MRLSVELRLFFAAVGLILLIPLVVGTTGALGGLEGMAALFRVHRAIALAPGLRNSLRAICWMFASLVPLVIWSLRSMHERAGGFRIIVACASLAGLTRLTGILVDGSPGPVPVVFMVLELVALPLTLLWHARLLRRTRRAPA